VATACATSWGNWPRSGTNFVVVYNGDFGARTGRFARITGARKAGQTVRLHLSYLVDDVELTAS
jgi:aspartate aminotransferase-like enzyme